MVFLGVPKARGHVPMVFLGVPKAWGHVPKGFRGVPDVLRYLRLVKFVVLVPPLSVDERVIVCPVVFNVIVQFAQAVPVATLGLALLYVTFTTCPDHVKVPVLVILFKYCPPIVR